MEVETKKETTYLIKLDAQEARILKALVQNAQQPDECSDFSSFRERLFNELSHNGVDFI